MATPNASPRETHDRGLRLILRPLVSFLETEAAGGIILFLCAAASMVVANSAFAGGFREFWQTKTGVVLGPFSIVKSLEWWVNDGLMTIFFFVVGLEIKRELVTGELRDPRKAALPAAAALGGMVVPALVYLGLSPVLGVPAEARRGWGVPMATDIAFVVGVLALLGPRVPGGLKIMLLSLAIVDDLGAIIVIAVAYTGEANFTALGVAAAGVLLVAVGRLTRMRALWAYLALGVVIWYATYLSGVHPTIAGVVMGLFTPAKHRVGKFRLVEVLDLVSVRLKADPDDDSMKGFSDETQAIVKAANNTLSPLDRLEAALHPWVAFGIMPLFALVNAGVAVDPAKAVSPVALACALGLIVGKPVGVVLFSLLAVRLGVAKLPAGVTTPVLVGAGFLAGIGFTMALFIATLGLPAEDGYLDMGKMGVLAGSVVAAGIGAAVLLAALPRKAETNGDG